MGIGAKANGLRRGVEGEEASLKRLRDAYLAALEANQKHVMSLRPGIGKDMRALREHAAESLRKQFPTWPALNDGMEREANLRIERLLQKGPRAYLDDFVKWKPTLFADEMPPPPDGEFWWADTFWHFPGGMNASWLTDGLHFFGRLDYNADPLLKRDIGAVARFGLEASRRPQSFSGRYLSAPFVELSGNVYGWTKFAAGLFGTDDVWCKCWLNLRQTALQFTPGQPTILASRTDVQTLIFEEHELRYPTRPLPGFLSMPLIEFALADPNLPIWIELEVRFDIQLEGASGVAFSPGNDPSQSVVLKTEQWKIRAV